MVYHVGNPAMFDGNMFLPDTGMPIWKIERMRTRLAVCEPEPLTVATWIVKSLTTRCPEPWATGSSCVAGPVGAIETTPVGIATFRSIADWRGPCTPLTTVGEWTAWAVFLESCCCLSESCRAPAGRPYRQASKIRSWR